LPVFEISLCLVRSLRAPLARLEAHDGSLATQTRRAGAGGQGQDPALEDRGRQRGRGPGGAAVAEAFGYVDANEIEESLAFVGRVLAMLWRLCR
jgi:hypothetical protein